jgi:cyclic pyranopterin phosphate synthase
MPVGYSLVRPRLSIAEVKNMINQAGCGTLEPITAIPGNGPAKYYQLTQAKGTFGFITPVSEHFCYSCSRIRLTADGKIKPCLLSNQEIDIKPVLRSEADDKSIYELFLKAVQEKPLCHNLGDIENNQNSTRGMVQIGG